MWMFALIVFLAVVVLGIPIASGMGRHMQRAAQRHARIMRARRAALASMRRGIRGGVA